MRDLRKDYRDGGEITINDPHNPLGLLADWVQEAKEGDVTEPNAMCLATVDDAGKPHNRMVLLKYLEGENIGFFTNLESDKSLEIQVCQSVAATLWWPEMERQVRIEGNASPMDRSLVEDYYLSRPRKSRIAAWASDQSRPLESREQLLQKYEEHEAKYPGDEIPLPPFWGGYTIRADRVEYWAGRPSRLHDRVVLSRKDASWIQQKLCP